MDLTLIATPAAYAAAVAFVLSGAAFGLFVRAGWTGVWGPVNDVFIALAALLVIPAMLAHAELAVADVAGWFGVLTWLAVAGAVVMAAGQLLLVARLLSLGGSFVTGTIGVVPFLAWIAAHAALAIVGGLAVDPLVGWLGVGVLLLSAVLAAGSRAGGAVAWLPGTLLMVLGTAWLVTLGLALA